MAVPPAPPHRPSVFHRPPVFSCPRWRSTSRNTTTRIVLVLFVLSTGVFLGMYMHVDNQGLELLCVHDDLAVVCRVMHFLLAPGPST